ncbi:MAG: hypothetical protein J6T27_01840 [Alphaproteobacteria bacterium]|nr:hypothetical protein [Alphaproteobacteria bacterium]
MKIALIASFIALIVSAARANSWSDGESVLSMARSLCGGISSEISNVSGGAKINTAVTGVGTIAGGGALYAGIKKSSVDAEIERLEKRLCANGGCDAATVEKMSPGEFMENVAEPLAEIARLTAMKERSKKLGNWRTGLLVGASATHVASAIMSGINKNQSELAQHISACNAAIEQLKNTKRQMLLNDAGAMNTPVYAKINSVINSCNAIDLADVAKIEKREKVVMGASIAGGAAAVTGAITSASANSPKTRADDSDAGKRKEKNLNTASNVLAGVSTAGSGVATGFNISLITLTKKMMERAEKCERAFE